MKKLVCLILPALAITLLVIGFACRKSSDLSFSDRGTVSDSTAVFSDTTKTPADTTKTPTDTTHTISDTTSIDSLPNVQIITPPSCPYAPNYGDSVIYDKWKGLLQSYKIKPLNNNGPGKYFAIPKGLVINSTTGEINVSQSESGVRYMVGFIKSGTTDTCYTKLIIGGITYVDGIYVMNNNDTLAIPYYNANPNTPKVCDNSGDDDYPDNGSKGNDKCEFDDDGDLDGYGLGDQPPLGNLLNTLLIRVRTVSGIINLKKSLVDGAFGLLPINGMRLNVTLYYRLNNASGMKLQKIPITFIYYNKASDIPQAMKNEIATRQANFYQYRVIDFKPRPPMIILTRSPD